MSHVRADQEAEQGDEDDGVGFLSAFTGGFDSASILVGLWTGSIRPGLH